MFSLSMWGDLAMLMPVRSGLFKSINRNFPYLTRGYIVILALVVIVTSELSASTTWSAAPSALPSVQVVDRTSKGDRKVAAWSVQAGDKSGSNRVTPV